MIKIYTIFIYIIVIFIILFQAKTSRAESVTDHNVFISVDYNTAYQYQILLSWKPDVLAKEYAVFRKFKNEKSWQALASLSGKDTNYVDTLVQRGVGYEYKIVKTTEDYYGYGYVYTGLDLTNEGWKGKLLLLVDNTIKDSLASELNRFENDLIGDGWSVIRKLAPRAEKFDSLSVVTTKSIIEEEYNKDPINLKSLILFGRIPVPYTGEFTADGHFPAHFGAWPADVFYGIFNAIWTDSIAYTTTAEREENRNIYFDGKYDQTMIPGDVSLQIGRIDFYNLPSFKESEIELYRRYINKNHRYRNKINTVNYRSLIDDTFWMYSSEVFASNAWMNFSSIFKMNQIDTGKKFTSTLGKESYLWAYGCGEGYYTAANTIAYTDELAKFQYNAIFVGILGSYLGDWDSEDNLLRAAIASSPSILISFMMGRPYWHLHHLSLGDNIGYSTQLTQNNRTTYISAGIYGYRQPHIALMGDPTLKIHIVAPPRNPSFLATKESTNQIIDLFWESANDTNIVGYNVYKYRLSDGRYTKLNDSHIKELSFSDTNIKEDTCIYLIKTVKYEKSVTGTYYNESQGVIINPDTSVFVNDNIDKLSFINYYPNPASDYINICYKLDEQSKSTIEIFDLQGNLIKSFDNNKINSELNYLHWDLKDSNNNKVRPGIYILKLSIGLNTSFAKLSVIY